MSLKKQLLMLRPQLAAAATEVLRGWQPDDEYCEYGDGGVCDSVTSAMAEVIGGVIPDIQITDGGHDGDDHAWLVVKLGDEVYGVDIPPHVYEQGGGMKWTKTADEVGPYDVAIFDSWWPDGEEDMQFEDVDAKISEGTVTADDINALIETSYKSAQERILRRTRAGDSNDGHDDKGHAVVKRPTSRLAPRRGGGKLNDPRRTARGRRAVMHQEDVDPRANEIAEEWYHPDGSPKTRALVSSQVNAVSKKYNVSAEEACSLLDDATKLRGGKLPVGCESHLQALKAWQSRMSESSVPAAKFMSRKHYDPVCPHCNEAMGEKSCVPDHVRSESGDVTSTTGMWRHRGDCYDKGPFTVDWPKDNGQVKSESKKKKTGKRKVSTEGLGKYEEATRFILEHRGRDMPIDQVSDISSLRKVVGRLLTVDEKNRDWMYGLYRKLGVHDGGS